MASSTQASMSAGSGGDERQVVGERGEELRVDPADHAQGLPGGREAVGRGDLLGDGQVVLGLGGADVGDGDEPDVEAALGLLALTADGLELGLAELDVGLGAEHVEVGRRDAQDQRLLHGEELGVGLPDAEAGLIEQRPRWRG